LARVQANLQTQDKLMRFLLTVVFLLLASGCLGNPDRTLSYKEFFYAYGRFVESDYLMGKWRGTCVFPLNDESNVILIAKVIERGEEAEVKCYWKNEPVGVGEGVGVLLSDGQSDIDPGWYGCGKSQEFSRLLRDAVHNPGSNLAHLGSGLGGKENATSYVIVSKCHFWDENYCERIKSRFCRLDNSSDIISVAYAVLDDESGGVYW